jgi:hypothetical protein
MRMQFGRPAGMPLWIGGMALCVLAATGVVAVAHSVPASFASGRVVNSPADLAAPANRPEVAERADREVRANGAPAGIIRRGAASCRECGVVESTRRIDNYVNSGRHDAVLAPAADTVPGGAGGATTGPSYEVTVRLRDGSRTTFTETTPRAWRSGARVMVIAGPAASGG